MALNTHCGLFLMHHFVHTCTTSKLKVISGHFTYQMTVLLSEIPVSIFWVRAVCGNGQWVMAPNMHCSLFPICHLCVLPRIAWKLQVVCGRSIHHMIALLLNTFLVWVKVAWDIRLENYGPRHAYIHHYSVHNYVWQENSRSLWLYYTPNNGFTANNASFYKNKFGNLLNTRCSVFPIRVDAIHVYAHMLIFKLIRSTNVLLDKLSKYACTGTLQRICCQTAKKKEHTLGAKNFTGPSLWDCKKYRNKAGVKHQNTTLLQKNRGKESLEDYAASVA